MSLLGGTYGSREREISSTDVKRGDDCLQAELPITNPNLFKPSVAGSGLRGVVQLVRTLACHAGGHISSIHLL
jgi:hypothetical protein